MHSIRTHNGTLFMDGESVFLLLYTHIYFTHTHTHTPHTCRLLCVCVCMFAFWSLKDFFLLCLLLLLLLLLIWSLLLHNYYYHYIHTLTADMTTSSVDVWYVVRYHRYILHIRLLDEYGAYLYLAPNIAFAVTFSNKNRVLPAFVVSTISRKPVGMCVCVCMSKQSMCVYVWERILRLK